MGLQKTLPLLHMQGDTRRLLFKFLSLKWAGIYLPWRRVFVIDRVCSNQTQILQDDAFFLPWWPRFDLLFQYLRIFWYLCCAGPRKVSSFANIHEPDTYCLEISIMVKGKATQIVQWKKTQWVWTQDLDSMYRTHISLSNDWTICTIMTFSGWSSASIYLLLGICLFAHCCAILIVANLSIINVTFLYVCYLQIRITWCLLFNF